ncbi:hypothetical protein LSAT2_007409, partial [Lamellibrachia satsuma]
PIDPRHSLRTLLSNVSSQISPMVQLLIAPSSRESSATSTVATAGTLHCCHRRHPPLLPPPAPRWELVAIKITVQSRRLQR